MDQASEVSLPPSIAVRPNTITGSHAISSSVSTANVPVRLQVATTGVQVMPLPVKPALHAQENAPAVFVHVALAPQLSVLSVHSSMSVHVVPLPVKPAGHAQV